MKQNEARASLDSITVICFVALFARSTTPQTLLVKTENEIQTLRLSRLFLFSGRCADGYLFPVDFNGCISIFIIPVFVEESLQKTIEMGCSDIYMTRC